MKVRCIINPTAGKGRAVRAWIHLKPVFKRHFSDFQFNFTKYTGHAAEIAQNAIENHVDLVIAIGGDGTLQEISSALVNRDIALGVIPAGTGNDFARSLKIPQRISEAGKIILEGKCKKVDAVKVNEKFFVNMAGLGFDAEVARRVNEKNYLIRSLAYIGAIIETIFSYTPVEIELSFNGTVKRDKITLVAIGNGQYVGGGIRILPRSDVSDGLLDICIVKELKKWEILKNFLSVYAGRHLNHPKCQYFQVDKITVNVNSGKRKACAQFDGELLSPQFPLNFSIAPKALKVIVP